MNPGLTKTYVAGGSIETYRIVAFGSDAKTVVEASAHTAKPIGVTGNLAVVQGERVDVIHTGIGEVACGGSITRGDLLTASSGLAVVASAGQRCIGVAMDNGVTGDVIPVLLNITTA